jgi:hypothetical protein
MKTKAKSNLEHSWATSTMLAVFEENQFQSIHHYIAYQQL